MSRAGSRIRLEVLAFAANALLLPSAAIYGGLILMGFVLTLAAGTPWHEHPAAMRVVYWFLPPEGSYRGAEAAGVFASAFFKANLALYLVTLPLRLLTRKIFGASLRFDAVALLAFTIVLGCALAVAILNTEFTNGGNGSLAAASVGFAFAGYALALPYLAVSARIDSAIESLAAGRAA